MTRIHAKAIRPVVNVNNPPLCLDTANRRLTPPIDQVQASEQSSGLAVSIADQMVLRGNRTSKRPAQEIRKQRTMAKEGTDESG